jgi:hypothetical protein
VVKREEIPIFVMILNVWNIRVVERYENDVDCVFLSFDGLPGE